MAETTTPSWDDIAGLLGGNTDKSIEAQMAMYGMGLEASEKKWKQQREDLLKAQGQAVDTYQPFREGGQYWLQQAQKQIEGGAPQYQKPEDFTYEQYKGQDPFQYESFDWNKDPYQSEGWDQYAKEHLGKENIEKSPFYDLYNWQKDQQQSAIDKGLRARGMYGSGKGITDTIKDQTGLEQQFTADEYGRAQQNYQTEDSEKWRAYQDEYEKALQGHTMGYGESKDKYSMTEDQLLRQHNMGYEEAKQKYGISKENYDRAFGVEQGQWTDKLNTALGLGDYAWKAGTGQANAYLGTGSQLGTGAIQTGNAQTALAGQTGQGIGSSYNALNNQLGSVYGNTLNYGLGQQQLAQGQSNYDNANATNLALGLGTLGVKGGSALLNYWNKPTNPTSPSSITPQTIDPTDYSGNTYGNYWDTGDGAYW